MTLNIEPAALIDAVDGTRESPWVFVPVTDGGMLGIADVNVSGYTPVPAHLAKFETYDDAQEAAEALNKSRGYDVRAAFDIIATTMRF